jgi:hypothetical protein
MKPQRRYKYYDFKNKDPIIAFVATCVALSNLSHARVAANSGVSGATLTNWFHGPTRRPQYATVAAVLGSLGYTQTWSRSRAKVVPLTAALKKAS